MGRFGVEGPGACMAIVAMVLLAEGPLRGEANIIYPVDERLNRGSSLEDARLTAI